jgi:hypothetical protein
MVAVEGAPRCPKRKTSLWRNFLAPQVDRFRRKLRIRRNHKELV